MRYLFETECFVVDDIHCIFQIELMKKETKVRKSERVAGASVLK